MHTSDNVVKEVEDRCEWDVCDNYGILHQKREEEYYIEIKNVYFIYYWYVVILISLFKYKLIVTNPIL